MQEDRIEIKSDEAQEVLGQAPLWIIQWGITSLFGVVLLVLIGSWIFKYPEIIVAPIIITSENPPASIIARSSGKIVRMFVNDKQQVNINQYLGYIENPTKFEDYIEAKKVLENLKIFFSNLDISFLNTQTNSDLILGDLQTSYSGLNNQIAEYKEFISLAIHNQMIKSYIQQKDKYESFLIGLQNQYNITRAEHLINQKQFSRDSILYMQSYISDADFDRADKSILQSRRSIEDATNMITSTQIRIKELEQSILDLELEYYQKKNKIENELRSQYDYVLSQFAEFEYNYLLKSPIKGTIAFTEFWSVNQNVTSGELVFTIIPSEPNETIGKIKLPIERSGKVKCEQKVIIKLDNFPYKEYGILIGTVKSISLVPTDNSYILEITLKNKLTTNYNKVLYHVQEMQGTAEIVTEDIRLIERMIQPAKYIFKRNIE